MVSVVNDSKIDDNGGASLSRHKSIYVLLAWVGSLIYHVVTNYRIRLVPAICFTSA